MRRIVISAARNNTPLRTKLGAEQFVNAVNLHHAPHRHLSGPQ